MSRPVIGLTTYPAGAEHGWHTPVPYVEAVLRAGGVPVLLPSQCLDGAEEWLAAVDAVVLIGGGDIDPKAFGGPDHETIYGVSPERDHAEMALLNALLAKPKPVLAICRGMQVLNTVLGGTLHVHLPDVVGEDVLHRSPERQPIMHEVSINRDSHLASLIGEQVRTASWHHQGIDQLGKDLQAVAWAADGVIEAVTLHGYPEWVAVQWHPELSAIDDVQQQGLFNWLVAQAKPSSS
ncbi:MAG: gamma-glutamyl-gamma-aminobutyrate hydrolase family protein [Neisseriaceae bacterium]|nr:gamma-glutamyl-gamma-aminobutyrate hydrolase family protein [Neisseriaceae bacterium]